MSDILNNGATLIITALLVLMIGYRYYSAFIAAKVLALDPARTTPAHTLKDGQNYHPTNKWILFGHHFAAISGAGPLIGPVLAAQFGYLPGYLWILIGVVLGGAVQDFVVLVLSTRRNGKSLAQLAFMEIGPVSGTAATIGILFVLVIALAGLGKVVTKALGGETVKYGVGTQFVAGTAPITSAGFGDSPYRIPKGTRIIYPAPSNAVVTVDTPFVLQVSSPGGFGTNIEITDRPSGTKLVVMPGISATRPDGDKTYTFPQGTQFIADESNRMQSSGLVENQYKYKIPAGTKIIDGTTGNETQTSAEFELTVSAKDIRDTGQAEDQRHGIPYIAPFLKLVVPIGCVVTGAGAEASTNYQPGTEFETTEGRTIRLVGRQQNAYHVVVPQGSRVSDSRGVKTLSRDTELSVRAADIEDRRMSGAKLVVPKDTLATQDIAGSSWGTFTIALTIPIALAIGFYLYRIRKGRVLEASIIGGLLTLGAVYLGGMVTSEDSMLSTLRESFNLTDREIGYSIAIYGFVASILPVWLLLCPRDYLSSFLKIGTVLMLILGIIVALPHMHTPPINTTFLGGGPVVAGSIFPFVFITIMCGAISGFHALVASGTTPKMIDKETDARPIGYGAMLMEGLVGIVALIAACSLPTDHYYKINTENSQVPKFHQQVSELVEKDRMSNAESALPDVGENLQGRTGGAVTLALGMASIFDTAAKNVIGAKAKQDDWQKWLADLYKYWYHFAIMFEALFILTTIDTGTRVGRFLLQETMGKWVHPKLGKTEWWPGAVLSTALISAAWWYFLDSNAFSAIWSMFGVANQMLAVMALAIASVAIARSGKGKYAWVVLLPMCFVIITTGSASIALLSGYFNDYYGPNPNRIKDVLSALCIIVIDLCTAIVVIGALRAARRATVEGPSRAALAEAAPQSISPS